MADERVLNFDLSNFLPRGTATCFVTTKHLIPAPTYGNEALNYHSSVQVP
jgi:hypothetical protein